jgi:DNA adenine methylase
MRDTAHSKYRPGTPDPPRPVLKWAGGKSRVLGAILQHFPEQIETYYEPFVGSAAVFFALAAEGRFKRAVLGDRNRELIDVYRALKQDVDSVVEALSRYTYDKDVFYRVRALKPEDLELTERAARTIFLNRTGFNGLYRVNRSGDFNVPFGRHVNPTICDPPRLRGAARALKGVKLTVGDFAKVCANAVAGDAVYFDPPYVPLSKTSNFTAYSQHAFEEAEHRRLADCFRDLARRKVSAVLSNSDTPLTRELYADWHSECVSVRRNINSDTKKRGGVSEIVVKNQRRRRARGR